MSIYNWKVGLQVISIGYNNIDFFMIDKKNIMKYEPNFYYSMICYFNFVYTRLQYTLFRGSFVKIELWKK